jgi:hypothetical protein
VKARTHFVKTSLEDGAELVLTEHGLVSYDQVLHL